MWPNVTSMLSWWQWAILAAVPPLIILLYFLKLKRRPLEVPSTYLWHKSIEDLHVNTIWQRLRRNLLLFLQLLVVFLAMAALLRPSWQERKLTGDRFIFLVDNSASMQATDVEQSRLEDARRKAIELIDQMKSGDVGMVISFADGARVEQMFTDDRRLLRQAVEGIAPTARPTSLLEALKVASGLANPGHIAQDERDLQVAEALPAKLYIFSDGRFRPVSGFSLGNLEPVFVPIGRPTAANVGIVAFNVRRSEADPANQQAFARLENFGSQEVHVEVELYRDVSAAGGTGRLINADQLTLPAGETRGVAFDLAGVDSGVLELRLKTDTEDDLAVDDRAWTVVSPPRPVRVLLLTPGNEPLELALSTDLAKQIAEVAVEPPKFLQGKPYAEKALSGAYDLVIYDRCVPQEMPRANTLFIGGLPPRPPFGAVPGWSAKPKVDAPQLLPVSTPHPLMQWIDLRDVRLAEGTPLEAPPGHSVLIDSDVGPMLVIAPREGFEDVVLGFVLLREAAGPDGKLERYIGTDWITKQSFPVFVLNLLDYFGAGRDMLGLGSVQPGKPVVVEGPVSANTLRVRSPDGREVDLKGGKLGKFSFTDTAELGPYEVRYEGKTLRWFAVNLADPAESDIRPDPQPTIKIGYVEVEGQPGWEAGRRDIWKWLLLVGLVVLLLEWYIYNRRVYV
jgi:hypothetical protein